MLSYILINTPLLAVLGVQLEGRVRQLQLLLAGALKIFARGWVAQEPMCS